MESFEEGAIALFRRVSMRMSRFTLEFVGHIAIGMLPVAAMKTVIGVGVLPFMFLSTWCV